VVAAALTGEGGRRRHGWQRPLSNTERYGKSFEMRYIPWLSTIRIRTDYSGVERREVKGFNRSDASLRNIYYSFIKHTLV